MNIPKVKNYVDGEWVESESDEWLDVLNPAKGEVLAKVPLSTVEEVNRAVPAANEAFKGWRETPASTRARYMFKFKELLEEGFDEVATTVVMENGKTLDEARGEVRRGVENVEVASGIPSLMTGYNLEDVSRGVDCVTVRQPIGVFCSIPPFNFPAMVPLWFMPYSVACSNTFVVKPSEQVPLSQNKIFEVLHRVGLPRGVVNLVNGSKKVVDALLENSLVRGVSFVGSSPMAKYVYKKASENGKRVQCLAGAKNFIVAMNDASLERTVDGIIGSAFGCAGERCLSGSVLVAVGEIYEALKKTLIDRASMMKVGYGLDKGVEMGPVISKKHLDRVVAYITQGVMEGANLLLDGRGVEVSDHPKGFFIGPTIFDDVEPSMVIAKEEIFGPVLCIMKAANIDEAIELVNGSRYGNAASIFTSSGRAAREFQYKVQAGMVGVNIGVPAPVAFFPFVGWKESFYGDLHGQGRDAIEFYTEKKVVTTRWF